MATQIEAIINGQVVLINDALYFKDHHGHTHPIINVASGIKSFGILQLLTAGKTLTNNSLLIIDEPEVHLHPEWQLKYAEVLLALAKAGVKVLVTSHSSYMIQALVTYAQKEALTEQTHVYWGEIEAQGSVFEEVTHDLDVVFGSFAAPQIKLMQVERAAQKVAKS